MAKKLTEDQVRDKAGSIMELNKKYPNIECGVGQLTTFNQLGFKGVSDKPDGWYLPKRLTDTALILECKNSSEDIHKTVFREELLKNIKIANKKYKNVVGILYNGEDVLIYKNSDECEEDIELKNKEYYLKLFDKNTIDKQHIYIVTMRINNNLHNKFGVKNLYHRMIFTACALVAEKEGAKLERFIDGDYNDLHQSILNQINKSMTQYKSKNLKLDLLADVYTEIKMNNPNNQEAINSFIEDVCEIADLINSDYWKGEDIAGIFFNEFNRYKSKSDSGQVFTPEHITSFMYRLIDCDKNSIILDAACGSGGFLVKAMSKMIDEAGRGTEKEKQIKAEQLYGVEFDREIFALVCANMLIHKDGKTNLEQMDSRTEEAGDWIKKVTEGKPNVKVLMNPPFETKFGCMKIVKNVLDNVPTGTMCAFILPDKKLEKTKSGKLLKYHKLKKIIKLPEKTFREGITTSIFIFEAGVPQNGDEIFGCYIEEDGLESVKNQGRQDVKDRWGELEDYWVKSIKQLKDDKYGTSQWINPDEHMSYQMPQPETVLYEEDFMKTALDYLMFKEGVDKSSLESNLLNVVMYGGDECD